MLHLIRWCIPGTVSWASDFSERAWSEARRDVKKKERERERKDLYPCVEYELLQLADVRSSQVYPVLRRLVL